LLATTFSAAGCKPEKPPFKKYRIGEQGLAEEKQIQAERLSSTVLARVGGLEIRAGEVVEFLRDLPSYQRYYYSTPEKIKLFLQNYMMLLLLSSEASAQGLDSTPYVRAALEEALAERYKQSYLATAVKPSDITEEEILRYIETTKPRPDEAAANAALLARKRKDAWAKHEQEIRAEYGIPKADPATPSSPPVKPAGLPPEGGGETGDQQSTSFPRVGLTGGGETGDQQSTSFPRVGLTGGGETGDQQSRIAWTEGRAVTREEVEAYLNRLPPFQRKLYSTREKKLELVKDLIRLQALVAAAGAEGLDEAVGTGTTARGGTAARADSAKGASPSAGERATAESEMVDRYLRAHFGEDAEVPVSDQEVAARYERDKRKYVKPERVRVSHILLPDKETADKVHAGLIADLGKSGPGTRETFRTLVKAHSTDAISRARGGDLMYFARDGSNDGGHVIDPAVVGAAFSIRNTNQVSAVVQGKDGFHILLLTDRKAGTDSPLSEVKEVIRAAIKRESLDRKRRAMMDGLVDFDAWSFDMEQLAMVNTENP